MNEAQEAKRIATELGRDATRMREQATRMMTRAAEMRAANDRIRTRLLRHAVTSNAERTM